MAGEKSVRRDPGLPFQEIDGRVLVVVPARREMHELDEVGTLLWRRLGERRGVKDLVGAVCDEYEVEEARAEKDVRAFLEELSEKGLVIEG